MTIMWHYDDDGTAIVVLFYSISCSVITTGQFKITSVVFDFVAMPADLDEQKQQFVMMSF